MEIIQISFFFIEQNDHIQINGTESIFQDELIGEVPLYEYDCIINGRYCGSFKEYHKEENIIEFMSLQDEYHRYDTENRIWSVVPKEKSIIHKRDEYNRKAMIINQQIIIGSAFRGFEIKA